MDEARWQRVKEVFAAALERDATTRSAYLDAECGGDTELRSEIDSLISAHETADEDFIEKPAAHRALGLEAEPQAWIGRRVGDYRLVEEVGRGGMSEVYKAVRDDDEYRKDVAVKVLRKGYDTKSLLRRFRAEIQILATLDHPNIARLLDAGSTPEGLPYLVMDYIQGMPLDEYANAKKLGVKERLELFRSLCGAVQYVHQHLMVHGDLKCSNVLVSDQGAVKLLDFGIARILSPKPGVNVQDAKLTSLIALTPEYASPEQVRGGAITTASDVYSLGVVLYRLLTGVLPHRLRGDFSYELASQILEREATPPSVAVREHVKQDANASAFVGFERQLRGDLDNIVLMALEKHPAKRYPSVEAFEADIRRHLEGFPVEARAAGPGYRLMKFAGRHKAGIIAITMLIAALTGGIVSTTWQAQVAWAERERAERHFNEVRKLANVFMFDLHNAIADLPGSTPARQMLVENSLRYLEALSGESGNEASLQRELASAYEKVADIQGGFRTANLGDYDGAMSSIRKALAIRETLSTSQPTNLDLRRELLRNYGKLSEMLTGLRDSQGAMEASRHALRIAQELAARPDAKLPDRRNLASALASVGWQLTHADRVGDGIILMRQSIAIFESLHESAPDDFELARVLCVSYDRTADVLLERTNEYAEALRLHTRASEVADKLLAGDVNNVRIQKAKAYALLGIGLSLEALKRPHDALAPQLQAIQIMRGIFDADPRNDVGRFDASVALLETSGTYLTLGDLASAERRLTETLGIISDGHLGDADATPDKVVLAVTQFRLGQTNARRAASPTSTRLQRSRYCQEAQQWFDLSRPVLLAAGRAGSGTWRTFSPDMPDQISRELEVCASVRTASK